MGTSVDYCCGFCGEWNSVLVDLSQGEHQSYIEDCAVCCRPNKLTIHANAETGDVEVQAEFDG